VTVTALAGAGELFTTDRGMPELEGLGPRRLLALH
jgi:hypothetical protein